MIENKKSVILGVEYNQEQLSVLLDLYESDGWVQLKRLLDHLKTEDADGTLGNPEVVGIAPFLQAQGEYQLINKITEIQLQVQADIDQLVKDNLA